MISVEQPSRWVQLILKESKQWTTYRYKISDPPDGRPRSVVLPSHSLFSMDEHALETGYHSPSSYTRRRARAPTPRRHSSQSHPPPLQGDLGSSQHSGARSSFGSVVHY